MIIIKGILLFFLSLLISLREELCIHVLQCKTTKKISSCRRLIMSQGRVNRLINNITASVATWKREIILLETDNTQSQLET